MGLRLASQLPWIRGILFIPVQLVASLYAGGLGSAMFPVSIAEANTILGGGMITPQGLFMEMFFTSLLTFVVLMLAIEKSEDIFLPPVGIALALFVSMIARIFSPDSFSSQHSKLTDTEALPILEPHLTRLAALDARWRRRHFQGTIRFTGSGRCWELSSPPPFIASSSTSTTRKPTRDRMQLTLAKRCRCWLFESFWQAEDNGGLDKT